MKIALINGSPKLKSSASAVVLEGLKGYLGLDVEIKEMFFRSPQLPEGAVAQIASCDAIVFAFPLYVDGIPSHMVSCLIELEVSLMSAGCCSGVYALVNCGFYEGHQNGIAMRMVENWCQRAGLRWGGGVGVGAGGMMPGNNSIPMGRGPKKNLGQALAVMAEHISSSNKFDNIYVTANFPKIAYKLAAEFNWRKAVKKNGLTAKDLFRKPGIE